MGDMMRRIELEGAKPKTKSDSREARVGDTVEVHTRIVEGEKERIQVFTGTVIARKGGTGLRASITVRRIVGGEGVERIFPTHSPRVEKIIVKKRGRVRRAKLHFLREKTAKESRLREIRETSPEGPGEGEAVAEDE